MRLIDADAMNNLLGVSSMELFAKYWLDKMPTIEAEPVVRCKDCKYRIDEKCFASGHCCVMRMSNGGRFCKDNDFCSYGERREEA